MEKLSKKLYMLKRVKKGLIDDEKHDTTTERKWSAMDRMVRGQP